MENSSYVIDVSHGSILPPPPFFSIFYNKNNINNYHHYYYYHYSPSSKHACCVEPNQTLSLEYFFGEQQKCPQFPINMKGLLFEYIVITHSEASGFFGYLSIFILIYLPSHSLTHTHSHARAHIIWTMYNNSFSTTSSVQKLISR